MPLGSSSWLAESDMMLIEYALLHLIQSEGRESS